MKTLNEVLHKVISFCEAEARLGRPRISLRRPVARLCAMTGLSTSTIRRHFTEEEEMLQKKFAKLRKKKKALAALRAPKPEPPPVDDLKGKKRTAEAAADATAQAKKLLKLGAIKVEVEKKDLQSFKRTKRTKDQDKPPVGFTPFSPSHSSTIPPPFSSPPDHEDERAEGGGRSRVRALYDNFVPSRDGRFDRERREREPPKRGKTIYVRGHGLTEDVLKKTFSNFGTIININMEKGKNCGFVTFDKMESSDQAIAEMNNSMVSDIQLEVSMARRQPTFENATDASSSSWGTIAASNSQKSSFKDKRELVSYEEEDIF